MHVTGGVLGVATASGALPFTGLSLLWWALVAAMLLVIGATLLRLNHWLGRARTGDRPEYVPVEKRAEP